MPLRRQTHANFSEVSAEFKNLDDIKQDGIVFANRAPTSSDKGSNVWINYAGTTGNRWYFRHPITGAWTTQ